MSSKRLQLLAPQPVRPDAARCTQFVEELERVDVVRHRARVAVDEVINGSPEHEQVVDRDVADTPDPVPVGLSAHQ